MHSCEVDKDCGSIAICVSSHGCVPVGFGDAAIPDMRTCGSRCQQAPCRLGQTCRPDGHCVLTACAQDADCPANFACDAGAICARRACRADGECQGACVKGLCYPTPGTCAPPAA
jgi:hypothetical protein